MGTMLNVNTALYSAQGIDSQNVYQVANRILNSSQKNEPAVEILDYSKFNRATLGVDLYSSRTNANLQKQIALTQAGLYAQAVNVAKLNSRAAQNLYAASTVQQNVELTQSIASNEFIPQKRVEEAKNNLQLFSISDKNPNSSNGFNPFLQSNKPLKEENEEKGL